jgi:serine phosphatase RsbU (regulator of sigma subunit)
LLETVRQFMHAEPDVLVQSLMDAVEKHRNGSPVSDDCSLLVAALR